MADGGKLHREIRVSHRPQDENDDSLLSNYMQTARVLLFRLTRMRINNDNEHFFSTSLDLTYKKFSLTQAQIKVLVKLSKHSKIIL